MNNHSVNLTNCLVGMISIASSLVVAIPANAAIINFDVLGKGGSGLLPTNEVPSFPLVGNEGTGGEIGSGLTYDTDTNRLNINIGWGSAQGFTDLSSNVGINSDGFPIGHIHKVSDPSDPFNSAGGVIFDLGNNSEPIIFTNNGLSGTITGFIDLTAEEEDTLFARQFYFNIHTVNYPGGEIRGNLVPVPEPITILGAATATGFGAFFKRRLLKNTNK